MTLTDLREILGRVRPDQHGTAGMVAAVHYAGTRLDLAFTQPLVQPVTRALRCYPLPGDGLLQNRHISVQYRALAGAAYRCIEKTAFA